MPGPVGHEIRVRAERTRHTAGIWIRVRSLSLTSVTSNKSTVSGSLANACGFRGTSRCGTDPH